MILTNEENFGFAVVAKQVKGVQLIGKSIHFSGTDISWKFNSDQEAKLVYQDTIKELEDLED